MHSMRRKFVIKEHHATLVHFDLRLEFEGVLVSWAVSKGLTMIPEVTRLATRMIDHNLRDLNFEGTRRKGLRGTGEVCIWDSGEFEADCERLDLVEEELSIVTFYGRKIVGNFTFQKWKDQSDRWSIIKVDDEFADRHFELKYILLPTEWQKATSFCI
jgi:bifunctional non-homologous end joining protein LigD